MYINFMLRYIVTHSAYNAYIIVKLWICFTLQLRGKYNIWTKKHYVVHKNGLRYTKMIPCIISSRNGQGLAHCKRQAPGEAS